MSFLDPSALAQLGTLQLKARIVVQGALTGLHRARLHGSSVEFAQHKEYSPGDEIRHIDWKAYAKVDRYYVKQFEQESQLLVYLVLDASASMAYAGESLSKFQYASYLAASLAYLLIRQRDRVGLCAFGDPRYDRYVPPRARATHLHDMLAVIEDIDSHGPSGAESAAIALERIAEITQRRRALIILISDLLGDGERSVEVLRRLRAQGHDPVVFHILDAHELEFPFQGLTLFDSLEDERKVLVNPDAIRRQYMARLEEFLEFTRSHCVDSGVEYHLATTARPVERTLLDFLGLRVRTTTPRRAWSF